MGYTETLTAALATERELRERGDRIELLARTWILSRQRADFVKLANALGFTESEAHSVLDAKD
jgi:hypothetical protein